MKPPRWIYVAVCVYTVAVLVWLALEYAEVASTCGGDVFIDGWGIPRCLPK